MEGSDLIGRLGDALGGNFEDGLTGKLRSAIEEFEVLEDVINDKLNRGVLNFSDSMRLGAIDATREFANQSQNAFDLANMAVGDFGRGMAQATVDVITGAASIEEAFGQMAASILADLAEMIIQQQIFNLISGFVGGGSNFQVSRTVGTFQGVPVQSPTVLHDGGVVGMDGRPHGGGALGANEVPAILERGELVLSRGDVAALSRARGGGVTFNVQPVVNVGGGGQDGNATLENNDFDPNELSERVGAITVAKINEMMVDPSHPLNQLSQ